MKKKHDAKFMKMCYNAIERYMWRTRQTAYSWGIKYMDKDFENSDGEHLYASATTDVRYLTVTFSIYPILEANFLKGILNQRELERILAHEVGHVIMAPSDRLIRSSFKNEDEAKDVNEQASDLIGRLLWNVDEWLKK